VARGLNPPASRPVPATERASSVVGTTLHYPYEIRSDEAVFEEIPDLKLPDRCWGLPRISSRVREEPR
jgi:hypothetical protein